MRYIQPNLDTMMVHPIFTSKLINGYNHQKIYLNLFFRWTSLNPDNNGISGFVAYENCLELFSNGLNDVSCDAIRKYICEFDV